MVKDIDLSYYAASPGQLCYDAEYMGWRPIGTGFELTDLKISSAASFNAAIEKYGVLYVTVENSGYVTYSYGGSVCGINYGIITDCRARGSRIYCGGVAGGSVCGKNTVLTVQRV